MTNPNPTDPTNPAEGVQPAEGAYGTAYPTAGYPGTGYGAAPHGELQRNKMAPWALGVSIASIVLVWVVVLNGILAIVGIILSILALRSAGKIAGPFQRKGMSIASLILSILGLLGTIALFVIGAALFGAVTEGCENLEGAALQQCIEANANQIAEQNAN